jgi:signal transduction histidine kinase/ActR/RegA family two-component response regulator
MRQRALIDAIPDAMLRIAKDGSVLDSSIDPSTSMGRLIAANDGGNLAAVVGRIFADNNSEKFEIELADSDGAIVHVEVRCALSGEDEVTAILRDVTAENTMKARLMVANRMAAVGTLSVGIGHEINNPLTYVEGNLQYAVEQMREDAASPERDAKIVEALEDAREGADRVKRIVDDLKRSARSDAQEGEIANASGALAFAVRMAGNQLRNIAKVDLEILDGMHVHGAEGKLGQVFLNLLVNAGQAFDGENVEQNRIVVRASIQDDYALFEIGDNGPGIPAEIQSRIFDPFFTTKDVGEGTGLGLYICHQIISDLGGELTIESEPNKGTTATIKLRHVANALPAAKGKSSSTDKLRVLVIDDEPGILRACTRMLRTHEVTTCEDSPLALKLIADEDYDVIFCDLMMPKMTGMELFQSVERDCPEMAKRMVFISGGAFRPDAQKFLNAHADQHLSKPFDRTSLLGALDRTRRRLAG